MPGESRYDISVFSTMRLHCHPGLDPGSYDKGSVKCSLKRYRVNPGMTAVVHYRKMPNHAGHNQVTVTGGLIIQSCFKFCFCRKMPGPRIKRGAGEPGMTYFVSCHPGPIRVLYCLSPRTRSGSYILCHPGLDPGSNHTIISIRLF